MAVTSIGLLDTFGEWVTDFNKVGSDVGDIIQLTTPTKSSLVSALNSIDSDYVKGIIDSDYLSVTISTGGFAANTSIANPWKPRHAIWRWLQTVICQASKRVVKINLGFLASSF